MTTPKHDLRHIGQMKDGQWRSYCGCGWVSGKYPTEEAALKRREDHVAEWQGMGGRGWVR